MHSISDVKLRGEYDQFDAVVEKGRNIACDFMAEDRGKYQPYRIRGTDWTQIERKTNRAGESIVLIETKEIPCYGECSRCHNDGVERSHDE